MPYKRNIALNVTFRPFVEIAHIPPVDPSLKHMMYYSPSEMFMMEMDVKRQVMLYKKKREREQEQQQTVAIVVVDPAAVSDDSSEEEDEPIAKRVRLTTVVVPAV